MQHCSVVSHCKRSVAESSHVAIFFPYAHVSSAREFVVFPQHLFHELGGVQTHCPEAVPVNRPTSLLLVKLRVDKGSN